MNILKTAKKLTKVFRNTQTRKYVKLKAKSTGIIAKKIGTGAAIGGFAGAGVGSFVAPAYGRTESRKEGLNIGAAYGAIAAGGMAAGGVIFRRIRGRIVAIRKK